MGRKRGPNDEGLWRDGDGQLKEPWQLASVQAAISDAIERRVDQYRHGLSGAISFGWRIYKPESPLEALFLAAWLLADDKERGPEMDSSIPDFQLRSQLEVQASGRSYRLDFIVEPVYGDRVAAVCKSTGLVIPKVAVELDGHEFHERTKEQVAYRNQRDRDLQNDGWRVFHFSGSELYRDAIGCALEVWKEYRHQMFNVFMEEGNLEQQPTNA